MHFCSLFHALRGHDKPLTIRRASSVTISRLPQWEEVLERFRSKGGKLWMGRTSINTSTEAQQQGNYSDVDKFHLELYLPPEQFDYIASAISTTGPDRLKLSAINRSRSLGIPSTSGSRGTRQRSSTALQPRQN
jgi:hypothetical protein